MNRPMSDAIAPSSLTVDTIQAWFVAQFAEQLQVDPDEIDVQASFDHFSLDSVKALLIANRAEKLLGFQLSPTLMWHYPTIATLSQRLAEDVVAERELLDQVDEETLAQALAELESPS